MLRSNPILQLTEDGSHTLCIETMNETYHSYAGALTESIHVFIQKGFEMMKSQKEVAILEVGFGTGLNAILTLEQAVKNNQIVTYHCLEPYPISLDLVLQLQFGYLTEDEKLKEYLNLLHTCTANKQETVSPFFHFTRIESTLQEAELSIEYDIIYYDAFAPKKQPEMWDLDALQKCTKLLRKGGVFITYCANGQFKRNLRSLGFELYNPPGIKGRREITQAIKL
jgi:tRNA U34 5-methylaminomethyl-2-thiouridine-forming methyltransferase MnmC